MYNELCCLYAQPILESGVHSSRTIVYQLFLLHRTTVASHRKRLPLLFDTWITKVNSSQVFLITDGPDPFTRLWTSVKGMYMIYRSRTDSDMIVAVKGIPVCMIVPGKTQHISKYLHSYLDGFRKNNSEVFGFFTLNAVHAQIVWCSMAYIV